MSPATEYTSWVRPLLVFQLVYVISYIDRQLMSIAVEPIKSDLDLSDTQIGFLQGIAFSLFLAVSALFTAHRVDSGNRVRILGLCIIIWCVMTILCGFAQNFWMLLGARAGLAMAEAVVPVAILSIITDLAPRSSVPRFSALFMAAPYFGGGLALFLGGPILEVLQAYAGQHVPILGPFAPWRGLFWLIGTPGILLGASIFFFMHEPTRRGRMPTTRARAPAWPFLRDNAKFLLILMSYLGFLNAINMSIYGWIPTYLTRGHGMDSATVGISLGPIFAISGIGGSIFGSWTMSRGQDSHILSHVIGTMIKLTILFTVPIIVLPLAPNATVALVALALGFGLLSAVMTSALTTIQLFAPGVIRGRTTAICAFYMTLLGGLGPLAVGVVVDFGVHSPDRIGDAMAIVFGVAVIVAWATGPIALRMARKIDGRPVIADRVFPDQQ
jgi:MFS family permease